MVFFNLRQRTDSVQALLTVTPGKVSKQMVKWAAGLADESIVLVEGTARKTHEPIKSASVSDVEIHVDKVRDLDIFLEDFFHLSMDRQIHLISGLESRLPFTVDDANRPETEGDSAEVQYKRVLLETRLNNRVIDLRVTHTFRAIHEFC